MPTDNDDASSVSSNSSGARFLARWFQRSDSNELRTPPVPKYEKDNRVLMPSPMPSPSAKTAVPRPPIVRRWDSDSDDGNARQREEANVKRLVMMAKQQQSLMTAWFAASSGRQIVNSGSALPPRRSRSSRQLPVSSQPSHRSVSSSPRSSRRSAMSQPVDLDSVIEEEEATSSGESSSTSSQRQSFLQLVLPNIGVTRPPSIRATRHRQRSSDMEQATVTSGTSTVPISNVSRPRIDVEQGVPPIDNGSSSDASRSKKRSIAIFLGIIFVLATVTVVVSVVYSNRGGKKNASGITPTVSNPREEEDGADNSDGTGFASGQETRTPTTVATIVPTSARVPTDATSMTPSVAPTWTPSMFPTRSPEPSEMPSQAPTTIFSTTEFDSLLVRWGEQEKEQYGHSVSVSGNGSVVAMGAPDYSPNGSSRNGRVQVWERTDRGWSLRGQTLLGRNKLDQFGFRVALSDNGLRLAVSEIGFDGPAGDRSGNVRVFDYIGKQWVMVGQEVGGQAVGNRFGLSLALSGNGRRVAVGTPYLDNDDLKKSGHVRILEYNGSSWQQVGDALDGTQSLDWFGWDVDLSFDGSVVAVGAPRNTGHGGYVRCFKQSGDAWSQVGAELTNNVGRTKIDDRFGMAVSLSSDGQRVAVGSPWKDETFRNSGIVAVYQLGVDNGWTMLGDTFFTGTGSNHQLGWSVELSGDYLAIGIPGLNQVSFHRWTGFGWDTVTSTLQGDDDQDQFGYSVSCSNDGRVIVGGATEQVQGGSGYVRVMQRRDP